MALIGRAKRAKFFMGPHQLVHCHPEKFQNWAQLGAYSNCVFVQQSISGCIFHHHHYFHSAQEKKQLCFCFIETSDSRCLQGRLLCSLPHCILHPSAVGIVDLHKIQAVTATLPCCMLCCFMFVQNFSTNIVQFF